MFTVVLFLMVAGLFAYTFSNFFLGVYNVVAAKLAAPVRKSKAAAKKAEQAVLSEVATVEHFVGSLVAKAVAFVKSKL